MPELLKDDRAFFGGYATNPRDPLLIKEGDFAEIVNMISDVDGMPTKQSGRSKFHDTQLGSSVPCRGMHVHLRDSGVYIYLVVNSKIYYSIGGAFAAVKFQNDNADVSVDTSVDQYQYEMVSHNNYVYVTAPIYPIVSADPGGANTDNYLLSRALRLDAQYVKLVYYDSGAALSPGSDEVEVGSGGSESPWPKSGTFMIKHKRRAVVFNYVDVSGTAQTRGYAASEPNNFEDWTPANTTSNVGVNTVNEAFSGAFDYDTMILAFTRTSVMRILTEGEFSTWQEQVYEVTHGCISHWTIRKREDGWAWYCSWDGVYRTNGYQIQKMSSDIDEILQALPQLNGSGLVADSRSRSSQTHWDAYSAATSINTTVSSGTMYLGVGLGSNSGNAEMTELPSHASGGAYTYSGSASEGSVFSVSGGILTMADAVGYSDTIYTKTVTPSFANGFLVEFKAKTVSGTGGFRVQAGASGTMFKATLVGGRIYFTLGASGSAYDLTTSDDYHTYTFVVFDTYLYLFVDEVYRRTYVSAGGNSATTFIVGKDDSFTSTANILVDYVRLDADLTTVTTPASYASDTIDLGATPVSWGTFECTYTANGQPVTFEMETSSTGSFTGTYTAVSPGGTPTNTLNRYVRVRIRRTDVTTIPSRQIEVNDLTINFNATGSTNVPVAISFDGRYILSFKSVGGTINDTMFICGRNNKWYKRSLAGSARFGIYSNGLISAQPGAGYVYNEFSGTLNDGATFTGHFVSATRVIGDPSKETLYDSIFANSKSDSAWTLKFGTRSGTADWDSYKSFTSMTAASYGISTSAKQSMGPAKKGDYYRVRVEVDNADANFLFAGYQLHGEKSTATRV